MISSDQEVTFNPRTASRVQEVAPVTINPMHELTLAPSSPSRMSFDPCSREHSPSGLGEASEVGSRDADEGPITIQRDGHETDKRPEHHEGAAPSIVGDEDISEVEGGELILSEQPIGLVEVTPEVAEVSGNEGLSTEGRKEPDLGEHSSIAALSEMNKGAGDEGPDTIRGETVKESSGVCFKLAPPEVAIDMAIVPLG
ncbi:hypothetical protein AMTR_s00076p00160880 [Amborella trichopoda]|uniref:Uncharacterized protein n=1 Tax=Amborella trichopoda TaxID=13333 RepID=W1PAK8_AMBTC|nr:hypothetical protein AMTR_s00076p00160880 [Amborella trichopoda]